MPVLHSSSKPWGRDFSRENDCFCTDAAHLVLLGVAPMSSKPCPVALRSGTVQHQRAAGKQAGVAKARVHTHRLFYTWWDMSVCEHLGCTFAKECVRAGAGGRQTTRNFLFCVIKGFGVCLEDGP